MKTNKMPVFNYINYNNRIEYVNLVSLTYLVCNLFQQTDFFFILHNFKINDLKHT